MSDEAHIVVIDDDPLIATLVQAMTGLKVLAIERSFEAEIRSNQIDEPKAIFLDYHLQPELKGSSFIVVIRERWPDTPIIALTSDTSDEAIEAMFANGVDDFILKPLKATELKLRFQKRAKDSVKKRKSSSLKFSNMILQLHSRSLSTSDAQVFLTPQECLALQLLVAAKNHRIYRKRLRSLLWPHTTVTDNSLDQTMSRLRSKLKQLNAHVTVRPGLHKTIELENIDVKEVKAG